MKASESIRLVQEYLPLRIRSSIMKLNSEVAHHMQEIRLRINRPLAIRVKGVEHYLTPQGTLTDSPQSSLLVSGDEIAQAFQAICSHSVYSHEQDLAQGYVTIRGGCRVGICASAYVQENAPIKLRNISGLNFRIAGEYIGIADSVWEKIRKESGGILIAGSVGSGKTTFLRDICRLLGNRYQTCLVDERGEIAAVHRGIPQHDIGLHTDAFDGYPRATGILTALRVMTPQYIVCDEISTQEDVEAILQASGCGVAFAATCHARNMDELMLRSVLRPLFDAQVFRHCIFLEHGGTVRFVKRLNVR